MMDYHILLYLFNNNMPFHKISLSSILVSFFWHLNFRKFIENSPFQWFYFCNFSWLISHFQQNARIYIKVLIYRLNLWDSKYLKNCFLHLLFINFLISIHKLYTLIKLSEHEFHHVSWFLLLEITKSFIKPYKLNTI